ncbi:MAG: DUF502 domain-containing protein [candidate division Zixibacteria bacterium]|nr:DUF502 domain-containing protein [candidate division Zixibacteria bacterium]
MKSIYKMAKDILRRQFLSGVLVVVPLILTYVVLRFLFDTIDGILSPYIVDLVGYSIPGLGIISTILIILLTGFFVRSIVGASIYKRGDNLLTKLPIVRIFYMAAKKLIEALAQSNNEAFKEVVMFEYPRKGIWAVGFLTSKIKFVNGTENDQLELVGVFVPSTPTPVSGIVIFAPREDIISLDITVEAGLKLIVSGGIVAPPVIRKRDRSITEV